MIILIGASASGKTQIAKQLYKMNYQKCITTTTREKRINEVDGVDYHFLTKEAFNDLLLSNAFIEVTKYQDNLYGLQRKDIIEQGLVIVDPAGANNLIRSLGLGVFVVFIKSSKKRRKARMLNRGDQLESIISRLKSDDKVFKKKHLIKVDLTINNKDQPLEQLAQIIHEHYVLFTSKLKKSAN